MQETCRQIAPTKRCRQDEALYRHARCRCCSAWNSGRAYFRMTIWRMKRRPALWQPGLVYLGPDAIWPPLYFPFYHAPTAR